MELKHTSPLPEGYFSAYRQILTHTHFDRKGDRPTGDCRQILRDWCRDQKVDALGVGSPWTKQTRQDYHDNETILRDAYYARDFPEALLRKDEIAELIRWLNEDTGTLFYLDNETPKGRNGHLWYFGFRYLTPAWHDYSQDRPVRYYLNDPHVEINPLTGRPHQRRPYYQVVHEQRDAGALAVWAHPTSWWPDPRTGAFTSNVAAELPAHLILDGMVDGMVVSGYDVCHREYRALYFMLLDQGYMIRAFAETDMCPADISSAPPIGNHVRLGDAPLTATAIRDAVATADCYLGNGIKIAITLDGAAMGAKVKAERGCRRTLKIHLAPRDGETRCSRLEVNGLGGKAVAVLEDCTAGCYEFEFVDDGSYRHLSSCAFGAHDDHARPQQQIRNFAMTNPIFLVPASFPVPGPQTMRCQLAVRRDSPYLGWKMRWTDTGKTEEVVPGERILEGPAALSFDLIPPDASPTIRVHPFFEDAQVQSHISCLSEGLFRRDHPECVPGAVPCHLFSPELWKQHLGHLHAVL
jgi:hypothetical protein